MRNATFVVEIIYLAALVFVVSIIYYIINNHLLTKIGFNAVDWLGALIAAVILTVLYKFAIPAAKHKK